ncbi:MAG: hypothetical protein JO096_03960, partial [Alphaproteobacteria bacterium]|nr:hypothetical protein [Alphaproteobacteria bacterium]
MMNWSRLLYGFSAIAVAVLGLPSSLRDSVAAAAPFTAIAEAPHKLFLWRVTGGKGTAWLLGS